MSLVTCQNGLLFIFIACMSMVVVLGAKLAPILHTKSYHYRIVSNFQIFKGLSKHALLCLLCSASVNIAAFI